MEQHPRARAVLSAVPRVLLMTGLVIIGLILMHGMNLHNSHANGAVHESTGHQQASNERYLVTATAHTTLPADTLGCADCDQQGQAHLAAAGCVIAFFVVFILLRRPTAFLLRKVIPARAGPGIAWPTFSVLRAPNLISLCISRT
ncbi:DUF6153 family protein [Glutamicibacter sp.]|uniref:DUF6153 family protein n=1 Tax=Glutamicibacter sp. TaxID=1931995 RepID=UPI0028BE86A2|nr:DUF6153 family protein [Glutamicibacter sp.]